MTLPSLGARASTLDMIENFMEVRRWQDANLPIYGSFIGLDLVLFLSRSRVKNTPYSLKDVFHSLKYSEGALRIFIRRLEKDGWIKLETWPGDRRNKKIIVNDNLFNVIERFLNLMGTGQDIGNAIPQEGGREPDEQTRHDSDYGNDKKRPAFDS